MRLDILFFLGYDLDEELPRHSTLSRTRQLYEEEVFKKLFRQSARSIYATAYLRYYALGVKVN